MSLFEWCAVLPLALAWVYLALGHGRFWRPEPVLDEAPGPLSRWPKVCVVIPARNEADTLPQTLPALLGQDYPGEMEIRLVDDNSTDGTRGIAEEIRGRSGSRAALTVVAARPLEPGWTGKLWAMDQGVRSIQGAPPDYFLFTDADIRHDAGNLRALVSHAETHRLDLVSQMVLLRCELFWEKLLIPAFVFFFQKLYPFAWVNRPGGWTAGAAGGCILIRPAALEKIGGIGSIRSALIDDCTLARAVKRSGGRLWLGLTHTAHSLRSYESLESVWTMVARTAFTQLNYSVLLLAGTLLGMFWLYLWAPALFIGGLLSGSPERVFWGGSVWLLMSSLYAPMLRFYAVPLFWAPALPLVAALYSGMTFHSAWLHWLGSGGRWKGRSYS
jgi:hopene-associated glycosyltransferase HpnB